MYLTGSLVTSDPDESLHLAHVSENTKKNLMTLRKKYLSSFTKKEEAFYCDWMRETI